MPPTPPRFNATLRQWATYFVIGGTGTIVSLVVFGVLSSGIQKDVGLLILSAAIGTAWSPVAYLLHSAFTFKTPPSWKRFVGFLGTQWLQIFGGPVFLALILRMTMLDALFAYGLSMLMVTVLAASISIRYVFKS